MYTRQRTRKRYLQLGRSAVSIIIGKIEDQETDVIVNTTNAQLDLGNAGQCSKVISTAGGSSIQAECKLKYPRPLTLGDVAVTTSGNLKSSKVFHVYLPKWKQKGDEQNLETTVTACLEQMEMLSLKSIAFPALGTRCLNYCPYKVINALFDAVEDYNNKHSTTVVENITCVVFQEQMYQTFVFEAKKRSRLLAGNPKIQASGGTKYLNTNIQILVGDLVLQQADVLVYSSPHNMKLITGTGLSTEILKSAGSDIQDELNRMYKEVVECGTFVVTDGYNLRCSKVYHGYLPSFYGRNKRPEKVLSTFVSNCLIEANKHETRSVVFSALGSGMLRYPTDVAASAVVKGIQAFLSCNPTSIDSIKIVVYGGDSNHSKIEKTYNSELATINSVKGINLKDTLNQPIPRRGTKAYFCFKYNEDPRPPTNWSFFKSFRTIKDWSKEHRITVPPKKVQIDKDTFESIKQLFMKTIKNPSAKIKSITRNENLNLYLKYFQRCQELYRKAIVNGPCKPLAKPVLTMGNLNCQMRRVLERDINEVYLFHGTKQDRVKVLLRNGFDERLASMNFAKLRLGNGTYTAEEASLSAHYTEQQGVRTMFLVRACLGDVFRTKDNQNLLKRPPCKNMCKTICTKHDEFFDSVLGEFCPREFVVYEKAQCYPEYVIKYTL